MDWIAAETISAFDGASKDLGVLPHQRQMMSRQRIPSLAFSAPRTISRTKLGNGDGGDIC